jgi:uncharacterized membrane protein
VHRFELSPNCALTRRSAPLFFLSVVAVCLPVAVGAALLGAWMVLPFAGLELAGLAAALCLSLKRGQLRERLQIDELDVQVARYGCGMPSTYRFARPRTRVELRRAAVPHWPSRLLIGEQGRSVEIGAFLTESERERLSRRLAEVLPARGTPWRAAR